MIYYLNIGFILEQALVDVVKRYLDRQKFDEVYGNFHISVVNEHPFAHMIVDDHPKSADNFPSVVITTQSDSRPADFRNLPTQTVGVGFTSEDLDILIDSFKRKKTRINSSGEIEVVKKNNTVQMEKMPGVVFVYDPERVERLKEIADSRTVGEEKGMVYGIKVDTRRKDRVSIEIWAENNQLKNEIYEHLRLLTEATLEKTLDEFYSMFHPSIFGSTIQGERSSNYNFDFDCLLCGSHISFEVEYDVAQIVLDTEVEEINYEIVTEVINHVKER